MNAPAPRVSVALATYQGSAFLETQIRSILAQSHRVDEIVLSDDGSSDDTLPIAERVLAEATGVDVVILRDQPRLGPAGNFERAIRATTGEIVLLSDQDDVWHPDRVARSMVALSDRRGPVLVHGDARRIDAHGELLARRLFASLRVTSREFREIERGDALRTYLRRNLVTGATVAVRRELLDLAGPFPDAWVHDEWLGIMAAATGRVVLDRTPLIDYRQHDANEIGAGDLTLGVRVGRLRSDRGARNARLLRRAEQFRERIASLPPDDLVVGALAHAEAKVAHERVRSSYPARRLLRLAPVLREWVTGRYSRYGRARFDIPRDLLQPSTDR